MQTHQHAYARRVHASFVNKHHPSHVDKRWSLRLGRRESKTREGPSMCTSSIPSAENLLSMCHTKAVGEDETSSKGHAQQVHQVIWQQCLPRDNQIASETSEHTSALTRSRNSCKASSPEREILKVNPSPRKMPKKPYLQPVVL